MASDGAAGDQLGASVSISGDIALVAATFDGDNGADSGSAYVFRDNGSAWIEEAKLLPSDGASGDQFGRAVSVSGDIALVGAPNDDDNGSVSGSAYVFRYEGSAWIEEAKLLPSDGALGDQFGYSVSISGDTALVGARYDDDTSGSAYAFRYDGSAWIEEAKLLPSDAGSVFGESVSISGHTALVGSPFDSPNLSGSAYVFIVPAPQLLPSLGYAALLLLGALLGLSGWQRIRR